MQTILRWGLAILLAIGLAILWLLLSATPAIAHDPTQSFKS